MKLLSISAELPPFNSGGYEVGAWRVSHQLQKQFGIEVYLLTSMRGVETGLHLGEQNCYRILPRPGCDVRGKTYIPHQNPQRTQRQRQLALQIMREMVETIQPDAVLFWQVFSWSLYSLQILDDLKQKGIPFYLYSSAFELPWFSMVSIQSLWQAQRWSSLSKYLRVYFGLWRRGALPERVDINWSHVAFCSQWLQQKHIELDFPAHTSQVIHWGIDIPSFVPTQSPRNPGPLRLLWASRICRDKGLHVVIDALTQLPPGSCVLDIYGHEDDQAYIEPLYGQVKEANLEADIQFKGFIQSDELRRQMPYYDAFILSSIWQEPFSIVLLEAAAAGLALIATLTGGTPEILSERNAVVYEAENPKQLAQKIQQLIDEPDRLEHLKRMAFERAKLFSMETMIQKVYQWIAAGKNS
ncbi:MAG: glycosyltransferase family 4 protein [Leptolyngbyaceae cyanobacterium bins.59]|nr:glycosyltransferase family 4 protein [Leptolyngbyaceae cyanobacterium bins.59]